MSPASRPVKLACLACRASKIRCDGQRPCASCSIHNEECRYQPSRRGGARRGPLAARELAKKRAYRQANETGIRDCAEYGDMNTQSCHHYSHTTAAVPSPVSPLFPVELPPGPSSTFLENCSVEYLSSVSRAEDTQDAPATVELSTCNIRAYCCDEDLINAYYIFIHPYFPCLPPPAEPLREDRCETIRIHSSSASASVMPYWPTSSLALAIGAILILIPPTTRAAMEDENALTLRGSFADLYACSALASLEDSLEPSDYVDLTDNPRSTLHSAVLRRMEPVLALGLLSLYECCHRGNIPRMRIRANQALTTAMDLSLHTETSQSSCSDAQRRCWWATMYLVYLSSIMNASFPIITFDDPRITTIYPEFRGCREPWPLLVKAQVALFRSCFLGRQLIREDKNNTGLPHSIKEDILNLDSFILQLAEDADRFRCVTNYQGAEADASRNLWAISNALIHTARLTLHRVRAFPNRPVFLDNHCDFLANGTHKDTRSGHRLRPSTSRIAEINALVPFTERESLRICLNSSLIISRIFRRLPSPRPKFSDTIDVKSMVPHASCRPLASPRSIPYMASCQLQSFYCLAMTLWRLRTSMCSGDLSYYSYLLEQPIVTTEVQATERLMEELELGMEALRKSIQADVVFQGVHMIAKEIDSVHEATAID